MRFSMATKKILIVDDEEDFCHGLKHALEAKGDFQVLAAADGRSGIRLAESEKPDLILLDIVMPDMSGTEVEEALMESSRTRSIPVIFVTAIVSESELRDSNGYVGSRMFIAKPVVIGELVARINAMLSCS